MLCIIAGVGLSGGVCEPGEWSQDCADAALICGVTGACPCSPF
jgi:hypothetical protein